MENNRNGIGEMILAILFENEGVCYFWAYIFEFIYDCLQCGRISFGHFFAPAHVDSLRYFEEDALWDTLVFQH